MKTYVMMAGVIGIGVLATLIVGNYYIQNQTTEFIGISSELDHATSSYMNKIVPTLDDFKNTLNESQDIETIFFKFGEPHADIGSGIHIYVYELNDSTQIWIGYIDRILYVQHVDSDGNKLERLFEDMIKTMPDFSNNS